MYMIHYDETHYILYPRRLYTFCIYIRYDLHLIFDKTTMFPTIPTRFSALESVGFRPTNPPGPMEKPVCPSVETSSFFPPSKHGEILDDQSDQSPKNGETWRTYMEMSGDLQVTRGFP